MQQIGNDRRQEIRRLDFLVRPDMLVGMNECNNGMGNNCLMFTSKIISSASPNLKCAW